MKITFKAKKANISYYRAERVIHFPLSLLIQRGDIIPIGTMHKNYSQMRMMHSYHEKRRTGERESERESERGRERKKHYLR